VQTAGETKDGAADGEDAHPHRQHRFAERLDHAGVVARRADQTAERRPRKALQ
jgi:hypothetical protein